MKRPSMLSPKHVLFALFTNLSAILVALFAHFICTFLTALVICVYVLISLHFVLFFIQQLRQKDFFWWKILRKRLKLILLPKFKPNLPMISYNEIYEKELSFQAKRRKATTQFINIFFALNLLIGIPYNKVKNKFIQIQNCMSMNEFKIN